MGFLAPLVAFFAANAPAIGAASAVAGAGTTIGEAIANSGGPQAPGAQAPPAPTPPNAQQLAQQRALVGQQLPNVIGATSGLASPGYDALIAQILSGVVGQPGANAAGASAVGQSFTPVNSQSTNAAVEGNPIQLSDYVNNFTGQ